MFQKLCKLWLSVEDSSSTLVGFETPKLAALKHRKGWCVLSIEKTYSGLSLAGRRGGRDRMVEHGILLFRQAETTATVDDNQQMSIESRSVCGQGFELSPNRSKTQPEVPRKRERIMPYIPSASSHSSQVASCPAPQFGDKGYPVHPSGPTSTVPSPVTRQFLILRILGPSVHNEHGSRLSTPENPPLSALGTEMSVTM